MPVSGRPARIELAARCALAAPPPRRLPTPCHARTHRSRDCRHAAAVTPAAGGKGGGGAEADPAAAVLRQYREQQQGAALADGGPFVLPLLAFPLPQLPTRTLTLPVEASNQRLFSLVAASASRLFGVAFTDAGQPTIESVGALCELTHSVLADSPGQPLLLVNARVVGRFQPARVIPIGQPFVTVLAEEYSDAAPADACATLQLAAQEARVWSLLLQVLALGGALLGALAPGRLAARLAGALNDEELLRWSPSAEARRAVPAAPAADPGTLARVQALGLLGDPATLAQRTREHLCQGALRPVSEAQRRERFSFALAAMLGLPAAEQEALLYSQSAAERLQAAERVLLEWRGHLAARKSLRGLL